VGGNYLLDNRVSLYMRFDHSGRESTISGTNFADNLLSAGITLQY